MALAQPFAHGDLKPDNIIVKQDGSLVLVDYDGMYVPAMAGQAAREFGSSVYRHPKRTIQGFDTAIDDFSLLVLLLELRLLAITPSLFNNQHESLLATNADWQQFSKSAFARHLSDQNMLAEREMLRIVLDSATHQISDWGNILPKQGAFPLGDYPHLKGFMAKNEEKFKEYCKKAALTYMQEKKTDALIQLSKEYSLLFPNAPENALWESKAQKAPSPILFPKKYDWEPEMLFVEGGTFLMGSEDGKEDEKPIHKVTLTDYYIGKYTVTQKLWETVMGSNPSRFKGENNPVENVSWEDCQAFIQKLNTRTGKTYRLLTEAEWEYAARGGNKSKGCQFAGSNNLDEVAWYDGNSNRQTHPVGQKSPNELGLYDMSGNVWEWCGDWYGGYNSNHLNNPKGAEKGDVRVFRGGSWRNFARGCRVSCRGGYNPTYRTLGFRLALQ